MTNRGLNIRGLNVRGLNDRVLWHGGSGLSEYTPSPTPPSEGGAYLVKAEGGGWQKYMVADGKYYIVKT